MGSFGAEVAPATSTFRQPPLRGGRRRVMEVHRFLHHTGNPAGHLIQVTVLGKFD